MGWQEFTLAAVISASVLAQPVYTVRWEHTYGRPQYACGSQSAAVDASGDLWVICDGHDYGEDRQIATLYKIDGNTGDLKPASELNIPPPSPLDYWITLRLVSSSSTNFVLSSGVDSIGGTFDGVFLTRMNTDGSAGAPVRIVPAGSQLQGAATANDGSWLVSADQSPLSVRKVTLGGSVAWVRVLGSNLYLPDLAAYADGSSCLSAEPAQDFDLTAHADAQTLQLIRLDAGGRITRRLGITAAQGTVAAGPGGICVVLYSDSREVGSKVRIAGFDRNLRRLWDAPTPLTGRFGRDFTLRVTPSGYLAIGEIGDDPQRKVIARLSRAGALEGLQDLSRGFQMAAGGTETMFVVISDGLVEHRTGSLRIQRIRLN